MLVKELLDVFDDRPYLIIFDFTGLDIHEDDRLILRSYAEYLRYKDLPVLDWNIQFADKDSDEFELHIVLEG